MRISNCSLASLWTKVERLTVHRLISVGSGTGPTTTASKRAAVSIICFTDRSRILCSYAFTRMRSLCSTAGATGAETFFLGAVFTRGAFGAATFLALGFAFGLIAFVGMLLLVGTWLLETRKLRSNLRNNSSTDSLTSFSDGEALLLF